MTHCFPTLRSSELNFPRPTRIRCLSVPQKKRIGKMARQVIETRATTENIPAARMRPPEASMERRSTERPRANAGAEMDTDARRGLLEKASDLVASDRPNPALATLLTAWVLKKDKIVLTPRAGEDTLAMNIRKRK